MILQKLDHFQELKSKGHETEEMINLTLKIYLRGKK